MSYRFRDVIDRLDGDRLRQVGSVGLIVGGIVAGATGDYGSASTTNNPLIPADAAFAIWLPIYGGCLGYAVYQALPSQTRRTLHRQAGFPLSLCVGLTGTWVWLQDPPLLQLPAIAATLAAGVIASRRVSRLASEPADRWVVAAPTGLLTGWLTLAAVVATIEIGEVSGWRLPPAPAESALALLGALAALGVWSRRRTSQPPTYAVALAWGLCGIAVESGRRSPLRALTAAVGAAAILATRNRKPVRT